MDWTSILTSIFTSLTVSLITFIFGLRAGKNQTDRPKLKEYYRDLTAHFENLFNSLKKELQNSGRILNILIEKAENNLCF